jgi:hypothetical protein
MKMLPRPLLALASFSLAFGLTCFFRPVPEVGPQVTALSAMAAAPHPVSMDPAPEALDPALQLADLLALPLSQRNDAMLQNLSRLLLPQDPEAAFRAAMAQWGDDRSGLGAAAEALVKKDPAAARRLLAECPDLRSKRTLEGYLMADEVSRNPREKLRWADENLEGIVKQQAVAAAAAALAQLDPAAALEFAAELPPGKMKTNTSIKALIATLGKDPTRAVQWILESANESERDLIAHASFSGFVKAHPAAAQALVPTLQGELQEALAFTILDSKIRAVKSPSEYFSKAVEGIQNLPLETRLPVVRSLVWNVSSSGDRDGRTIPGLLSAVTQPTERAAVIETLMTLRFATVEGPGNESPGKADADQKTLSLFLTPEDNQSAAQVVPFFTNLTETQRQDILSRLK